MAAQLLANDAMRTRSGKSAVLERWRTRRDGGPLTLAGHDGP